MINTIFPTYRGSNRQVGFTLLELLASLVIMSLVLTMAIASLSQFSEYGDRFGVKAEETLNEYLSLSRLKKVMEGTIHYYIEDNSGTIFPFFNGNEKELVFVANKSFSDDDEESVVQLQVVPSFKRENTFDLVIRDVPLSRSVFFDISQKPVFSEFQPYVVLRGATSIRFEYLGIKSFRQIYPDGISENYQALLNWDNNYSGEDIKYTPEKIKLTVVWPNGGQWVCIFSLRANNWAKKGLMLGGDAQ